MWIFFQFGSMDVCRCVVSMILTEKTSRWMSRWSLIQQMTSSACSVTLETMIRWRHSVIVERTRKERQTGKGISIDESLDRQTDRRTRPDDDRCVNRSPERRTFTLNREGKKRRGGSTCRRHADRSDQMNEALLVISISITISIRIGWWAGSVELSRNNGIGLRTPRLISPDIYSRRWTSKRRKTSWTDGENFFRIESKRNDFLERWKSVRIRSVVWAIDHWKKERSNI